MANTKGSDNPFPSVLFAEHVDPANPPAGTQRLFVDTDHLLKLIDSSGTVSTIATGSSGMADPMTTRGDIIIRNASNVTARLGRGAAGTFLKSDGTDVSWATPSGGGIPQASKVTRTAGDLTTSSTTFVDLTGASITLTTGAHRCLISFTATASNSSNGTEVAVDVDVDGSRLGQAYGLFTTTATTNFDRNMSFTHLTDVLSAASHTFKVQWKVSGGTGTMYAGTAISPYFFSVIELPV